MQEHHTLPMQSELIIGCGPKGKAPEICQKKKNKLGKKPNQNHAYHTACGTLGFVGQRLADTKGTIWKKETQHFEHYSKFSSPAFLVYFLVQYLQAIPQYTRLKTHHFYMELRLPLLQNNPYFMQTWFNIKYQLLHLKMVFVSFCSPVPETLHQPPP